MKPGDMVFVRDSFVFDGKTPGILLEIYRSHGHDYYVVLNPKSGERYEYQEHNLSEVPQ